MLKSSEKYFNKENELSIKLMQVRTSFIEMRISSERKMEKNLSTFNEIEKTPKVFEITNPLK